MCEWKLIPPLVLQIDKCFGFDTAVEEAQRALLAAKVEASSAYQGIGLVKLMGRQSGFIALQSSMASGTPLKRDMLPWSLEPRDCVDAFLTCALPPSQLLVAVQGLWMLCLFLRCHSRCMDRRACSPT